jgi:SAM-dependent methyltransferase
VQSFLEATAPIFAMTQEATKPAKESPELLDEVLDFYRAKLTEHGPKALGVGWNGEDRQVIMFDQILKVCASPRSGIRDKDFTLLDYGCGYGALFGHLLANSWSFQRYVGFDLLPEMTAAGTARFQAHSEIAEFVSDAAKLMPADYVVCTGALNVKQNADPSAWQAHVIEVLRQMWALARKGIAFNSLTSYSEPEKMRADLYYADPCFFFDYCKRHFSRQVALLHDYGLWEFTILVRREEVAP